MGRRSLLCLCCLFLLFLAAVGAGCVGEERTMVQNATPTPSYAVDSAGHLSLQRSPSAVDETVLVQNDTLTLSRLVLLTPEGNVSCLLSTPAHPKAAFVFAPGATEIGMRHLPQMVRYAESGYAFLFVDIRGNGGDTPGYPLNPQTDYQKFQVGDWPEYYLTIADLSDARAYLNRTLRVPVIAVGSSNGGRYAAIAAAIDPAFVGYIGVSTSSFAVPAQGAPDAARRFLASIDPGNYLGSISPRPVWIFHAEKDPIIPYADGQEFFSHAKDPKEFIPFNGDHGMNSEVDTGILARCAHLYGSTSPINNSSESR